MDLTGEQYTQQTDGSCPPTMVSLLSGTVWEGRGSQRGPRDQEKSENDLL